MASLPPEKLLDYTGRENAFVVALLTFLRDEYPNNVCAETNGRTHSISMTFWTTWAGVPLQLFAPYLLLLRLLHHPLKGELGPIRTVLI